MKIGIDFDSTIAKIDQPLLDKLNAIRGTNYRAKEWSDWNLSFLRADEKQLLLRLLTPNLYQVVRPYPGAREAIRSLSRKPNVELVCVTSNPEKNDKAFMEAKRNWLRRYIPELSDALISARDKSGLGLDVLIDDAPHHHEAADCVTVLVRRPWNQDVHCRLQFSTWHKGHLLLNRLIGAKGTRRIKSRTTKKALNRADL